MKELHRHSLKYATSEARTNRDFEAKSSGEIILYCSTVVLARWFNQKWFKMRRCTAPVYFVSFMYEDNQFCSFFTTTNDLLFDRFMHPFCGKPETVLQGIMFFVYFVVGCRHKSTEVHKCVIDGSARDFLTS